jgi:calmodulin
MVREDKSASFFINCNFFYIGNGYITTCVLKDILREIDSTLNESNLEDIIEEVDEDGSGTVDFNEFMAMMTGE